MAKTTRILSLLLVLAMMLCLLASCGTAKEKETAEEPEQKEEVKEETKEEEPTEEPEEKIFYLTTGGSTSGIGTEGRMYNVWQDTMGLSSALQFRALLLLGDDNTVKDVDMAESWEVSADGLTYTFVLKDLKWSDGNAVTAQDVKWSIEAAYVAFRTNANYVDAFGKIVGAEAYKAAYEADHSIVGNGLEGIVIDGNKITITLTEAYAPFADSIGGFAILPQASFAGLDDLANIYSYYDYWDNAVVCGKYVISEGVEKDYYVLVPNEYYEGEPSNFDKVVINYVTDDTLAAQEGTVDLVASNSADVYAIVNPMDNYNTYFADIVFARQFTFFVESLADGMKNEEMQDVKVRQAIAYAIDFPTVLAGIFGDLAKPTTTALSSSSKYYAGDMFKYDVDKAKSLLAEAGWVDGTKVIIMYYYSDQATQDFIDAIATYLAAVGITVEGFYTGTPGDVTTGSREYDIAYEGHSAFSNAQRFSAMLSDTTGDYRSDTRTVFGDLVAKLLGSTSEETTAATFKELQQAEWDCCYRITAYYAAFMFYVNSRISVPSDMVWGNNWYLHDYRFDEWDLA